MGNGLKTKGKVVLKTKRMGDALDLLGILFSCAEAGRPKRVGVAEAEREGAAAEADAMLAASTDMPMRRAARLRWALGNSGGDTGKREKANFRVNNFLIWDEATK